MAEIEKTQRLWKDWTAEDWANAVYCETCGLPLIMLEPNEEGIGLMVCPYCEWVEDDHKLLSAQIAELKKKFTRCKEMLINIRSELFSKDFVRPVYRLSETLTEYIDELNKPG